MSAFDEKYLALPAVGADYELRAHELLERLENATARTTPKKRGRPAKHSAEEPNTVVEAILLVDGYCQHGSASAMPPSVALLIRTLLKLIAPLPVQGKPALSKQQWKALDRETAAAGAGATEKNGWPSRASAVLVARHASATSSAVYKWRKTAEYLAGFWWLLGHRIEIEITRRLDKPRPAPSSAKRTPVLHWDGPTNSPIDGKTYITAREYADHLREHGAWVIEEPQDQKSGRKCWIIIH